MKKVWFLVLFLFLFTTGCGKVDLEKVTSEFNKQVKSSKAYDLKGSMEIYNNEDTFKYSINVNYQKNNKYKVTMINQNNSHEQIILKNEDAVYVVTPSLNKSFKFDSTWPDNSSQIYILSSLVSDLKNDTKAEFIKEDNKYVVKNNVYYPHNKSLVYQKLYFDKDINLEKVIVYDSDNNEKIKLTINKIDYKAKYDDEYFNLDKLVKEDLKDDECMDEEKDECNNQEETLNTLDDIIYPLYIPTNTYLNSKDKVSDDNSNRTILTFNGDKPFTLIEEVSSVSKELEITPVSGDPLLLSNSVAALSDNTLSWTYNNVDYFLTSSILSTEEMLTIAQSVGNTALSK